MTGDALVVSMDMMIPPVMIPPSQLWPFVGEEWQYGMNETKHSLLLPSMSISVLSMDDDDSLCQ